MHGDLTSILFLAVGRDNVWGPLLILCVFIFQKWDDILKYIAKLNIYKTTEYTISGTIYTNKLHAETYGDLHASIWAILLDITHIINKENSISNNIIKLELPYNSMIDDNSYIMIPADEQTIQLNKDLSCYIRLNVNNMIDDENKKNKINMKETMISVIIKTTKTTQDILSYINSITAEYTKKKDEKLYEIKHIIKPIYEQDYTRYNTIEFTCSKTFDNLFFDGKDELIHRLNTFKNRDKYKALGIPETLGILLYGEPGCGKTSAIKAISNYMNMSILIVPMSQIKTKKRLEELFFEKDNNLPPHNKRIYVFEEIDCNGWENIVRDRKYITESAAPRQDESIDKLAECLGAKPVPKKDDDVLTLGAVLEVIDGIVECSGRIIIMTTNHKEYLDPALLRPGRVDMQIEFKKLRRTHIAQIYEKWYGKPLQQLNDIPDYKYSQADISQLLFKHETNSIGFIKEIRMNTSI